MGQRTSSELAVLENAPDPVAMPHYEILHVTGLHSIAHLLPRSKGRCGTYILLFRNGDGYVGQALDVAARFEAHRRSFPDDIVEIIAKRIAELRENDDG